MKFEKFWDRLMMVILVGMAFLITIGALMRYMFNRPLDFVDETAGVILLTITFLGLASVQKAGRHVNIDTVFNWFPKKMRNAIALINWVVEVFWAVVVLVFTIMITIDYFDTQKRSISTDWLLYPFAAIMVLGSAMLIVEFFRGNKSPFSIFRRKDVEQRNDGKEIKLK